MNTRLAVVLLSVAIVTVKGGFRVSDDSRAKTGAKPLQVTPVRHFLDQYHTQLRDLSQHQHQRQGMKMFPQDAEEDAHSIKHDELPHEKSKKNKVQEFFTKEQAKKNTREKSPSKSGPKASSLSKLPSFAKLVLGDTTKPELASAEKLRNVNWRSVQTSLELPTKQTVPLALELLQKTEQLLKIFQEIQQESNGFVEDTQAHNANAMKDYTAYFN